MFVLGMYIPINNFEKGQGMLEDYKKEGWEIMITMINRVTRLLRRSGLHLKHEGKAIMAKLEQYRNNRAEFNALLDHLGNLLRLHATNEGTGQNN